MGLFFCECATKEKKHLRYYRKCLYSLVGRARFELATNGLKVHLYICFAVLIAIYKK